jgi:hypothetical protein
MEADRSEEYVIAYRHMIVGIGTVGSQFLSWKYLFRIFCIVSFLCMQTEALSPHNLLQIFKLWKPLPMDKIIIKEDRNLVLSFDRLSLPSPAG